MDVVFIWFTGDIIDFAVVFSTADDSVEAIIKNNKAKLKRILIILYNEIIINIALTHANPGPTKRYRKRPETYENGGKRLPLRWPFTVHRKTTK